MTIKEVAQLTGLTHQAIYKRLKNRGVDLATMKDKATGQFTPEGAAIIMELFDIKAPNEAAKGPQIPDATEVETLRNQVFKMTTEIEFLRNQVTSLEGERDYLRGALEREQNVAGMSVAQLKASAQVLPAADEGKGKVRTWWERIRGKRDNGN